jgi:1L-myo-inositol 1-phosphate cytidylyltransferase / CDP-L-myo-inositol myo-inositolphosphotransferase
MASSRTSRSLARDAERTPAAHAPLALSTNGLRPPNVVRRAVVLAAGQSQRLRTTSGGGSKLLLCIGGVSLVHRAVQGLLDAGVEQVIVVVGHDGKRVAAAVGRLPSERVRVVTAERWQDGNGASLAAAEPLLKSARLFAVQAGDHIFGTGVVDAFVKAGEPAVLVDDRERGATDEETKVDVVNGRAVAFGKHLNGPVVDCGLFLLPSEIFDAHRHAAAAGDGSLSGAVTLLAGRRPIQPIPIVREGWWQDIDTPGDIGVARRRLRSSLGKREDGLVSRRLNRPVSTRLSMALSTWHPPPDLLSVFGFAAALVAAVACASAVGWARAVLAGVLIQAASVLDGVDGETARLQGRAGPWGALLDGVLDRIGDSAIVAGLSIWTLRTGVSPEAAIGLGSAALIASSLSMAVKDRAAALRLPAVNDSVLIQALGGRDGRCLTLAVFSALSLPTVGLAVVSVTGVLVASTRLWRLHPRRF